MGTDKESSTRIDRAEKPEKCPQCGHAPLADILYGYVLMNEDLEKEVEQGRIVLGGCVITDDDPRWVCTECGQKIHRIDDSWPFQ